MGFGLEKEVLRMACFSSLKHKGDWAFDDFCDVKEENQKREEDRKFHFSEAFGTSIHPCGVKEENQKGEEDNVPRIYQIVFAVFRRQLESILRAVDEAPVETVHSVEPTIDDSMASINFNAEYMRRIDLEHFIEKSSHKYYALIMKDMKSSYRFEEFQREITDSLTLKEGNNKIAKGDTQTVFPCREDNGRKKASFVHMITSITVVTVHGKSITIENKEKLSYIGPASEASKFFQSVEYQILVEETIKEAVCVAIKSMKLQIKHKK